MPSRGGSGPYKKGRAFEQAYARALRARGYTVARTAGSKSPWDLITLINGVCEHVQLKKAMNCAPAESLRERLQKPLRDCMAVVVHAHPHPWVMFCEHPQTASPNRFGGEVGTRSPSIPRRGE